MELTHAEAFSDRYHIPTCSSAGRKVSTATRIPKEPTAQQLDTALCRAQSVRNGPANHRNHAAGQKLGGFEQQRVPAAADHRLQREHPDKEGRDDAKPPANHRFDGGCDLIQLQKRGHRRDDAQRKVDVEQRNQGARGKLGQNLRGKKQNQIVRSRRSWVAARNQNPAHHRREGHHKQ